MPEAISIIQDEHRSLAAVLHGLVHLTEAIEAGRAEPDFDLFDAMLTYIEEFPERLHHPKEDETLYRALRQRDPETAVILDRLESEHRQGQGLIVELKTALAYFRERGQEGLEAFAVALRGYASFHWNHMRTEEDHVLPRALEILTGEDWSRIDEAFRSNLDPLAGVDVRDELRELFRRIAHRAPSPIGVGPAGS
ncbi:MAG TPA: hemerythrin domain-containing protein [Anaeromyxobacteraceae bacterium]|nr:hemerythrin domain-containing protein [Anaeromyxobacteraceae bacterium]